MSDGHKGIYFGAIPVHDASSRSSLKEDDKSIKVSASNRNIHDVNEKEILELSGTSKAAQEKHAQLLRRMEAEKRSRTISVPTNVEEVVLRLRQINQPITLFGEGPADRRERLRQLLSQLELEAEESGHVHNILQEIRKQNVSVSDKQRQKQNQVNQLFYIPIKNSELKAARSRIFAFSIDRSAKRLKEELDEKVMETSERELIDRHAASLYITADKIINVGSQNGDTRPLSIVRYSCDNSYIATGSWSGALKIWDLECKLVQSFQEHKDRVTGLCWHPNYSFSALEEKSKSICLCTGSADGTARLYNSKSTAPAAILSGHKARLGRVAFHPSGDYIGTTSFDHSWRLWDVNSCKELLLQEGHYREVYAIAFQLDGALVATGDLDGNGRVWDIRSGKSIFSLQGHSKQILAIDFAKNGFQLATGSDDRTARIWDLRQRKCCYVVPAHSGLVSEVKYSPETNELFMTASYDGSLKLWRTRDWKLLSVLQGHDGKVMAADFSLDERHLVSCGYDRTFKFWAHENEF